MSSTDLQTFIRDAELSVVDIRQLDTPRAGSFAGHPAWHVTIAKRGNEYTMKVTFHVGQGDTRAPSLADVLDCVAADSAGYREARDFRDWCDAYGMDAGDEQTAETWSAVKDQARNLSNLLLDPELEERLLWETERL